MDPLFSLLPYILYVIPYVTALLLALIAGKFSVSCTRKKRVISTLLAFSIGLLAFFPWKNYKITALQERVVSHLSEDSIIKEYPLILKKYPHAYNPSLIPYKEGFLLSFRVKSYDFPSFLRKVFNVRTSYIGLVELDKDCKPSSTPYLLSLYSYEGSSISHSAQDARLFYKGKDIYLLFNDYGKIGNGQ